MQHFPDVIVIPMPAAIGLALLLNGILFSLIGQRWASKYVADRNNAGALFGFIFGVYAVIVVLCYFISTGYGVAATIALLWLACTMIRAQRSA